MTKETAREYLPLIQALADGQTIQALVGQRWIDCESPDFQVCPPENWRVKPQPRRWWLNVCEHGITCYATETESKCSRGCNSVEHIEVVEVMKT